MAIIAMIGPITHGLARTVLMRQALGAMLLIGACRIRYSGERRRFRVVVINRLQMGNIKPMPDAGSR